MEKRVDQTVANAVSDTHGNRVELLGGLRGLDPKVFSRAARAAFEGAQGPLDLDLLRAVTRPIVSRNFSFK